MINKKGLSDVVTTLIIILLSLVAIGIIWIVVNNVLEGGAETTEINAKCLQVDIKANAANCTVGGVCNVTYKRNAGGEDIDGIAVILSNGVSSSQEKIAGNLKPLDTKTLTDFATELSPIPNTVEIAAYFIDKSGNEQMCAPGSAFEF
jgi:hypothetical protein